MTIHTYIHSGAGKHEKDGSRYSGDNNRELRQLIVDMEHLEVDVEEELLMDLRENYHDWRDQVGLLQKAIYGVLHAGLLWPKRLTAEFAKRKFD